MPIYAGIWIDQEKAYIVKLEDGKVRLRVFESNVEKHVRLSGGARSKNPYGPQDISSEKKPEERRRHQLIRFFREVIRYIEDVNKLLIMGPGEAKKILNKEIAKIKSLSSIRIIIETADKMTEKQLIAMVKNFYL